MADEKTIATFEMDYLSHNGPAVESEMKRIVEYLKQMRPLYDAAQQKASAFGKSVPTAAAENAKKELTALEQKIALQKKIIANEREINKLTGNIYTPYKPSQSEMARASWMAKAEKSQAPYVPTQEEEWRGKMMAKGYGEPDKFDAQTGKRIYTSQEIDKLSGQSRADALQQMSPQQQIEYQITRAKQVFRRVADALLSFYVLQGVTGLIGGFFKSLIESNIQLENMDVRLKLMVGSGGSIEGLKKTILDLTVKTPFIIKDFTEAAVSLSAFGISAQQNLKPVADWAAAMGRDLNDMALAYAKIAQGSPRAALLLSTRGISKSEYDMELKKTHDGVEALNNIIARKFGDMSIAVSKTFQGIVSNIKDMWFQIAMVLGKPLFTALERDINGIFQLLGKGKDQTTWLTAFGESIANLYNILVSLLFPALAILSSKLIVAVIKGFDGFLNMISGVNGGVVATSTRFFSMIGVIMFVDRSFSQAQETLDAYKNSFVELENAMVKFGAGSEPVIQALEKQHQAIQNLIGTWQGRMALAANDILDIYGLQTQELQRQDKLLLERIEHEKELKRYRDDAAAREATKYPATDILDIQEEVKKKITGTSGMLEQMRAQIKSRLDLADVFRSQGAIFDEKQLTAEQKDALSLAKNPKGYGNLKSIYELLGEYQSDKIRNKTLSEAQASVPGFIKAMIGAQNPEAAKGNLEELIKSVADAPKATKELKDFSLILAEIEKERVRIAELDKGEPTLFSKITGDKALQKKLQEDLDTFWTSHSKSGPNANRDMGEYYSLTLKRLEAERRLKEGNAQYEKEYTTDEIRYGELKANQSTKQMQLDQARLTYNYSQDQDLNNLYTERQLELDSINKKLEEQQEFVARQREQMAHIASDDKDGRLKATIKITEGEGEILELKKQQYQVMQAIDKLPSRNLAEGLGKGVDDIRESLNKFNDDLAKMVLDGARTMGGGYLGDFIFGNKALTQNSNTMRDLNLQLGQVTEEANRAAFNANIIQRQDGETNDQYLSRVKMASQLNSVAATQFTYKTKELEILEKINQAEKDRNTLLTQRLVDFGDKIMNKLTDQLAGMAISGIGGLFQGGGLPPGKTSPSQWGGVENSDLSATGGVHIHMDGANIYGFSDFKASVDNAMQELNSRSSR
jgi:hypothetical protein